MTPTQLKEAIDNEINRDYLEGDDTDPYELAYRIAALTAEAMVGEWANQRTVIDGVEYGATEKDDGYNIRIAEERQLADEIKKLSE